MSNLIIKTNYNPVLDDNYLRDQIRPLSKFSVINPTFSFFSSRTSFGSARRKASYSEPEYDLYEIGRIIDTEAFVARAFNKKTTLIFRDGYEIRSDDDKNLEYISRRLREIGYVSGKTFDQLIREWAFNIVAFHNNFIVKVRKERASSGKKRMMKGKREVQPVAAYFVLAPETVKKMLNDSGEADRFRQDIGSGSYRDFMKHNVIHSHYSRRTGFTMGTPPLEPVKEDILALRRIEESVETLIYKSLFPIIHVKVGTDKAPAKLLKDNTSEVDAASRLLERIDDNGGLVTSERIELKSIGAESLALRVESYLDQFKKRVFAGLGMSAIDFGDGDATGRATGEVLSASLKDSVLTYQDLLERDITEHIFNELLLESGRYLHPFEISKDERVTLKFLNINTDERVKVESHVANMLSQGIFTLNEGREILGKRPLSDSDLSELQEVRVREVVDKMDISKQKAIIALQPKPEAVAGNVSKPKGAVKAKKSDKKSAVTRTGTSKGKKSKADGARAATKSIANPTNKKKIADKIVDSISRNNNIELTLLKSNRLLTDYIVDRATFGLMTSNEYIDDEIISEVNRYSADIFDLLNDTDYDNIILKREIEKIVDKADIYVNNITEGIVE